MKTKAIIIIITGVILIVAGVVIMIKQTPGKKETPPDNKNNEGDFIEFVMSKFSPKYFSPERIETKSGKMNADLLVEYKINEDTGTFYIKTKWLKQYFHNTIELATKKELAFYKNYSQNKETPFFMILGIGGKPFAPKLLFTVPLHEIQYTTMKMSQLNAFKKDDIGRNFYYDVGKEILK